MIDLAPGLGLGERFVLVRRLAEGAASQVWLAEDTDRQRRVALKVFHPEQLAAPAAAARLRGEMESARSLPPGTAVEVHELHEADGLMLLEMEYLPGGDLGQFRGRAFTVFASTLVRVAEALAANGLLIATKTLTANQIKDLGDTPVEVIPAVVGKYIWPLWAIGIYRAGATPYASGGGNITLGTQSGNVSVLSASDGVLVGATDQLLQFIQIASTGGDASAEVGMPIVAYNFDPGATLGDGTVDLIVYYCTVTP